MKRPAKVALVAFGMFLVISQNQAQGKTEGDSEDIRILENGNLGNGPRECAESKNRISTDSLIGQTEGRDESSSCVLEEK